MCFVIIGLECNEINSCIRLLPKEFEIGLYTIAHLYVYICGNWHLRQCIFHLTCLVTGFILETISSPHLSKENIYVQEVQSGVHVARAFSYKYITILKLVPDCLTRRVRGRYRREHPEAAKEKESEFDELFESDNQRELRQIFMGQSETYDKLREIDRKLDEVVGRQERTISLISTITTAGK